MHHTRNTMNIKCGFVDSIVLSWQMLESTIATHIASQVNWFSSFWASSNYFRSPNLILCTASADEILSTEFCLFHLIWEKKTLLRLILFPDQNEPWSCHQLRGKHKWLTFPLHFMRYSIVIHIRRYCLLINHYAVACVGSVLSCPYLDFNILRHNMGLKKLL